MMLPFASMRVLRRNQVHQAVAGCLMFLAMAFMPSSGAASVIVTVGAAGETNIDLGTPGTGKVIDFYIGEGPLLESNDSLLAITSIITLGGGVIPGPTGVETSSNSAGRVSTNGAGTAGYFGAGNLNVSSIIKGSDLFFVINQEFNNPQGLLNAPARERWFSLNLDTTGLAPATYAISISTNSFLDQSGVAFLPQIDNNLRFTVSAIPEPGSLSLLASIGIASGVFCRRRRS